MKLAVLSALQVLALLSTSNQVNAQGCSLCPEGVATINNNLELPNPDDDTVITCESLVAIAGFLDASSVVRKCETPTVENMQRKSTVFLLIF